MKQIKRGRAPSFMGGIIGVAVVLFGIIWTVLAGRMFPLMALFGIIFVLIGISNTIYNFKNATGKNRYSEFDIVDDTEEPDPLNTRFGKESQNAVEVDYTDVKKSLYCPYCGTTVSGDYKYCTNCGKQLP